MDVSALFEILNKKNTAEKGMSGGLVVGASVTIHDTSFYR